MNTESVILGMPMSQLRDVIAYYQINTPPEYDELMRENLRLRAKVSFYESRIRQMAMNLDGKP
jgi:hypothetical protein